MGGMKISSQTFEREVHLKGGKDELAVPKDRSLLFFVGRLGFLLGRSDLGAIGITHKPTPELEDLYMGFPKPYSQLTHTSTPVDLCPGERMFIRRPVGRQRGVLVVDDRGKFDQLRTDCFVDQPLAAALARDEKLSYDYHAGVEVMQNHAVTIYDFNSATGTHIYIPRPGLELLA